MEGLKNQEHPIQFVAFDNGTNQFYKINTDILPLELGPLVSFDKQDILITASATWAFPEYNRAILSLKRAGLVFYQLFYDLIPALFPHFYEDGRFGSYYLDWNRDAFSLCDGAFAISECTKKDMQNLLVTEQTASSIAVIRLGGYMRRRTGKKTWKSC